MLLELLKNAGIEIDAEKGEALNAALSAAVKEQVDSSVNEATTGLKSKNDELLGKLKTQQTAAQEATAAAELAARNSMTNDELQQSWQSKYDALGAEHKTSLDSVLGQMKQIKVDEVASKLASELSDYPDAIMPHIKARLAMEQSEDGSFKTTILTDGKVSALNLDEFKKEISESAALKPLIKVTMGGQTQTTVTTQPTGSNDLNILDKAAEVMYGTQEQ